MNHNRKIFGFIFIVISLLFYLNRLEIQVWMLNIFDKTGYNIVSHFACSDYCLEGEKEYTKIIYEGVIEENECSEIGGKWYSYYGWGEKNICLVK